MTDEYHAYNALSTQMKHHVINPQEQYVDGDKHTNTIKGFWSLTQVATCSTNFPVCASSCSIGNR